MLGFDIKAPCALGINSQYGRRDYSNVHLLSAFAPQTTTVLFIEEWEEATQRKKPLLLLLLPPQKDNHQDKYEQSPLFFIFFVVFTKNVSDCSHFPPTHSSCSHPCDRAAWEEKWALHILCIVSFLVIFFPN